MFIYLACLHGCNTLLIGLYWCCLFSRSRFAVFLLSFPFLRNPYLSIYLFFKL